ncbi:uracil-DNA glycosylase family protein [Donghicola sp.]|jgi:uracil-DNA glycosylase|uniref:uracil-DNA glycosylase family protein n=1 Tax=Donghicola sp. TaxID=1929294 RepID=UPI0025ED09E4|nr:uracil-DNA glycosylase family protein [Donghicola sp.]MCT4579439.1 uracil-DNA glycosylase family protein [Donghicola sp.]
MSKKRDVGQPALEALKAELSICGICAQRFAQTATGHSPRPVVWFGSGARLLIAGQAPGMRVHHSGQPFTDPSGDRLRDWMGVTPEQFYDRSRVAILPMAFCFPGYDAKGADLPPPPICAKTWRGPLIQALGTVRLTLAVGGYAQKWHIGGRTSVTQTVTEWRDHLENGVLPLPHPSWRNTAWLKKNPWFEAELLPVLRAKVKEVLND